MVSDRAIRQATGHAAVGERCGQGDLRHHAPFELRRDVKTNLLFFTKGGPTEGIWYYDLSGVKVGKKNPLILTGAPAGLGL